MKNFWRRMAAREGFTLVELVVVIAILAILAAVAYPAYTGYIGKANESADLMQLDSIKTAAQAATAETGELTKITITVDKKSGNTCAITTVETVPALNTDLFTQLLGQEATSIGLKSDKYTDDGKGTTIYWTPAGGWSLTAPTA